jgi:signal transduction histidine kinase
VTLLQVNNNIFFIIGITVAMLLAIAGFSIYILILFQKRKLRLLQQQQEIKENYEREILRTQIEIRDQAMNDVGRELHDHISQVMTLIKLNISLLTGNGLDHAHEERLSETKNLVKEVINDIRLLSKTLNGDLILQVGLVESIKHELARINRLNIITCSLQIEGEEADIPPNTAFIVFRILQENLHNILKHAHCKTVVTKLHYTSSALTLSQEDDGIGFDLEASNKKQGNGLVNMRRRAAMIQADLEFKSETGRGTILTLVIEQDK